LLRLPISNAIINTKTTITATVTQVGNALCDGFTLFVILDVVDTVTELIEELVVVVAVVTVLVDVTVEVLPSRSGGCCSGRLGRGDVPPAHSHSLNGGIR